MHCYLSIYQLVYRAIQAGKTYPEASVLAVDMNPLPARYVIAPPHFKVWGIRPSLGHYLLMSNTNN